MKYKPSSNVMTKTPSLLTSVNALLRALKNNPHLQRRAINRRLMTWYRSQNKKVFPSPTASTSTTIGKAMVGQTTTNPSSAGNPPSGLGKPLAIAPHNELK